MSGSRNRFVFSKKVINLYKKIFPYNVGREFFLMAVPLRIELRFSALEADVLTAELWDLIAEVSPL